MKMLVTGGVGFIGSSLVKRLVEMENEVVVLDNFLRGNKLERDIQRKVHVIEGDVRDEKTVLKACSKVDIIFHFAAVLGVDMVADNPVLTMETEALGMLNLSKACVLEGAKKIVYASTSGVYGKSAIQDAVKEDYNVSPKSSYAIAKRFNEIFLSSLYEEKRIESVSIRYFNVYGPKQDNRMVIPRFFEQAMNSKPITVYGSGEQTRDFTYIDDVVTATILLAKQSKGSQIYNVSNEKEFNIRTLAEKIIKICNSKSDIVFMDAPAGRYDFEVERRFGSSDKLFNATKFKPKIDLETGLELVYESILSDSADIDI